MNEYQLGQTLLVSPDSTFVEIAGVIEGLGWSRAESGRSGSSLVAGEPELATWTWRDHKPLIVYTFNPIVRLRALDVGTCPPAFRGSIASRLTLVAQEQVQAWLSGTTPRERLLGLWAAQEMERLDLLPQIERLDADPDPFVARESGKVALRLTMLTQSRMETLSGLTILAEAARPVIEQLHDPGFVHQLCPLRADCEQLFDGELTEALTSGIAAVYERRHMVAPGADYSSVQVTAAPAGLLRFSNELSNQFPQGYRTIAGWMTPNRIWLTWAYESAAGGKVRYDGLAWLQDHWVWIPKPFRILTPQALGIAVTET